MSPEIIQFPDQPPSLDTPENLRECLDLAHMIGEQIGRWGARARVSTMRSRGFPYNLAKAITEDCQPLGREPIDYTAQAGFGGTMTREDAHLRTEAEQRQAILSEWVARDELDQISAHNQALVEHLDTIASFARNPYAPKEFSTAIQSVRRLFILREQLALKIGNVSTLETSDFLYVAMKLYEDLS